MCDDPNVKGSKPPVECYGRQHFTTTNDLEHLGRHSLWKDSLKMEYSMMRSESSEHTWKEKVIMIHLWTHSEECAQEVLERNRMSPDMHTSWWHVKIRKLMETMQMVFTEQSEENDQMNTVRTPAN